MKYVGKLIDFDGDVSYEQKVEAEDFWEAFEIVYKKHIGRRPAGINKVIVEPVE